jgi:hypothetical protein
MRTIAEQFDDFFGAGEYAKYAANKEEYASRLALIDERKIARTTAQVREDIDCRYLAPECEVQ